MCTFILHCFVTKFFTEQNFIFYFAYKCNTIFCLKKSVLACKGKIRAAKGYSHGICQQERDSITLSFYQISFTKSMAKSNIPISYQ